MSRARSIPPLACAALGALGVMAACNGFMRNSVMQNSAAGTLSPVYSINPAITDADVAMLSGMSAAQQLTHLAVGDSMEIAMAQVAVRRTQDASIAEFARRMINDHGESLRSATMVAQHESLILKPAPKDTMAAHLSRMVDVLSTGTPSTEFDQAYVLSQIQLHQRLSAELLVLQGSLKGNNALRQHVDDNLPVVQAHLASAQRIAAKLGYTTASER